MHTTSRIGAGNQQKHKKGRCIMGDSSPKNAHKKSAQKQLRLDHEKQEKQKAIFAKQSVAKKK